MRAIYRESLALVFLLFGVDVAFAQEGGLGLTILPPPGCIPGDGGPPILVYVFVPQSIERRGQLHLQAELGSVENIKELGQGLYVAKFVVPLLGAPARSKFVGWWEGQGQKSTGLWEGDFCPNPTGRITVVADPLKLQAGEASRALLQIHVSDFDGRALSGIPLEITSNVGTIQPIQDKGNGDYQTWFLPPNESYPQVAIIMVANPVGTRLDRVAVARTVLPITAKIQLPGKAAPGTKIHMEVAGMGFGPVVSDLSGRFQIPILVPPGYEFGTATSVDQVGNRKKRSINLYLPQTNQLGLWAYPRELIADGNSQSLLLVTTMDRFGVPTDMGQVEVTAQLGSIKPIRKLQKGLYEVFYVAPTSVGEDRLGVRFVKGGPKSQATLAIKLLPGPTSKLILEAPEYLEANGQTRGKILVKVQDANGNSVEGQKINLVPSLGRIESQKEIQSGWIEASWNVANQPLEWLATIRAEIANQVGDTPSRIIVGRESLKMGNDGKLSLQVALVDRVNRPMAESKIYLEDEQGRSFSPTDSFGYGKFSLAQKTGDGPFEINLGEESGWISKRLFWVKNHGQAELLPINLDPALPPHHPLVAIAKVQLFPALPANIMLNAVPKDQQRQVWVVTARLTDSKGKAVPGQVAFSSSAGQLAEPRLVEPGVFEVECRPGAKGWKRILVSAVEAKHHIGAVLEILEP